MRTEDSLKKIGQRYGSGLRERILKGIGAQSFSQVVQILIRLVEVPLFLFFWGSHLYGEWLMLSAIPVYISIADGGFVGASCREMAMRAASGDRNGTLAIFQSTWVLLIVVSLSIGLLCTLLILIAPLDEWLGFSVMTPTEINTVIMLLILYVVLGFQAGLINGGFWVTGRYSSGMYYIAISQALEFVGLATAILLDGGPMEAAGGYLGGRLLGTCLMWVGQGRTNGWLRHGLAHVSLAELRRLAPSAVASLAFPLGNAFNIQGTRIVIGFVLGPSAIALFVPLRTFTRLAMQPAAIVNRLVEPELAIAHGTNNRSLFQHLFSRSCQLTLWSCLVACFLIGPSVYWIFPVWTNWKVAIDWSTYLILLSGVIINSFWYTALMVPYAINLHSRIAVHYAIIYGVVAVGCGFLGANLFGICGVAMGLLIVEAAMAITVIREALKVIGMNFRQCSLSIIYPPLDIIRSGFYREKKISRLFKIIP